eukprot:TRINITY_DN19089_c0_g1::TRINITY_DN19089_c0_g1_i1::g.13897::m.13897 TRINITY_DN19089_c0_g1::TRINITY_DN19089_c0_g1_i1::g.13897  ORF type:complete len:377 (+),score=88.66,CBM_20/PF00686.14/5.4e-18 TRINITY_DN19089_c0_g1_i1:76-1206(+)
MGNCLRKEENNDLLEPMAKTSEMTAASQTTAAPTKTSPEKVAPSKSEAPSSNGGAGKEAFVPPTPTPKDAPTSPSKAANGTAAAITAAPVETSVDVKQSVPNAVSEPAKPEPVSTEHVNVVVEPTATSVVVAAETPAPESTPVKTFTPEPDTHKQSEKETQSASPVKQAAEPEPEPIKETPQPVTPVKETQPEKHEEKHTPAVKEPEVAPAHPITQSHTPEKPKMTAPEITHAPESSSSAKAAVTSNMPLSPKLSPRVMPKAFSPKLTPRRAPAEVGVAFSLKCNTAFGQLVKVVGSHPVLGFWNVDDAPEMYYVENSDSMWSVVVNFPRTNDPVHYKYVIVEEGQSPRWETGEDRLLPLDTTQPEEVSPNDVWIQ